MSDNDPKLDVAARAASRARVKRVRKPKEAPVGLQATSLPAITLPAAGGPSSGPQVAPQPVVEPVSWEAEQARLEAITRKAIEADFKVFLTLVWAYLGLGVPSDVQLSIADYLQHGSELSVIMAFRGCGKSWITAAFALWTLYCNPQEKVMVVSGSMKRATQFTTMCLAIVRGMPLLQHLAPRRDQRQSAVSFDVAQARPAQSTSFSAFGITGQLVGQRAGLIIPDDVETNTNSLTVAMREKLVDQVKEFNAILTPGGRIKFLGTPQTNDSIYNKLPPNIYTIRIWPMVFPDADQLQRYGERLSPWVRNRSTKESAGKGTWPERFGDDVIMRQRTAWGSSGFNLQFMLDTSLSDANRYPLKLANLIVMGLDPRKGPDDLSWGKGPELVYSGLPILGFPGDFFYKPANVGTQYSEWNSVTAIIDPSDKGKDETAITIGAELNARVFVLHGAGWVDGTAPSTMLAIAKLLVRYRVQKCIIESNYGGTMFGQLLKPYVVAEWQAFNAANPNLHGGTTLEEERAIRVQKELRIISDLEPATQAHRIVVSLDMIEEDYREVMQKAEGETNDRYSLFYQYCNLTRDRDCLTHDDRLDTLAGLVGHYRDILGVNPHILSSRKEEEALEEELQALFDDADEVGGGTKGDPHHGALSDRHTTGRRLTGH